MTPKILHGAIRYNNVLFAFSLASFLAATGSTLSAHGGEDHSESQAKALKIKNVFTETAVSAALEAVLKYEPIAVDADAHDADLRLYLSDFNTNAPIDSAKIETEVTDSAGKKTSVVLTASVIDAGRYRLTGKFPAAQRYSVAVTVTVRNAVEIFLFGVDAGKDLPHSEEASPASGVSGASRNGSLLTTVLLAVSAVVMMGLAFLAGRRKGRHPELPLIPIGSRGLFVLALLLAGATELSLTAPYEIYFGKLSALRDAKHNTAYAHGGEDHGSPSGATPIAAGNEMPVSKESQFLLGLRTHAAAMEKLNRRVTVSGKVIATAQGKAAVTAPQSGKITLDSQLPRIGTFVRKGQTLAVLEQTLSATERLTATTEKVRADAEYDLAKQEAERLRQLTGFVSQRDLEQAEARLKTAEAARTAYRGLVSGKGAGRFVMTSPISGVITSASATRGQQVEANLLLFEVIDLSTLWVEARLYETTLKELNETTLKELYERPLDELHRAKNQVSGKEKSEAKPAAVRIQVAAYPAEVFAGKLLTVGDVIDEGTRTVSALFEVPNRDRRLKVGMLADAAIELGQSGDALLVPKEAVIEVQGVPVVFVHTAPETFVARPVSLGGTDGVRIEIKAGVGKNERVATSGVSVLKLMALGM